jgi:hypothetical protein
MGEYYPAYIPKHLCNIPPCPTEVPFNHKKPANCSTHPNIKSYLLINLNFLGYRHITILKLYSLQEIGFPLKCN